MKPLKNTKNMLVALKLYKGNRERQSQLNIVLKIWRHFILLTSNTIQYKFQFNKDIKKYRMKFGRNIKKWWQMSLNFSIFFPHPHNE